MLSDKIDIGDASDMPQHDMYISNGATYLTFVIKNNKKGSQWTLRAHYILMFLHHADDCH
jgi:hypothetical protein